MWRNMQSPCHAAESVLRGASYNKRGETLTCLGIVGSICRKTAQDSAEMGSKQLVYKGFQKRSLDTICVQLRENKKGWGRF